MDAHRLPDGHIADAEDSVESRLIGGPIQKMREATTAANPVTYITRDDPPFLILHGDQDKTVPHHQSELLRDALRDTGIPATFQTVSGGGHGGPLFQTPEVARMITAFFEEHLKRPAK